MSGSEDVHAKMMAMEKTDLLPEEGSAQCCAVLRAVSEEQEGTPLSLWQQEGLMPDSQKAAVTPTEERASSTPSLTKAWSCSRSKVEDKAFCRSQTGRGGGFSPVTRISCHA